jgi:hypothetical protein
VWEFPSESSAASAGFSHNVRKRPEFLFRNWHANSLRMDAISFSHIPVPGAAKVVSCASYNEIVHSCCGIP